MEFITEGLPASISSLFMLNILCSSLKFLPTLLPLLLTQSLAIRKTSVKALLPAKCQHCHNMGQTM